MIYNEANDSSFTPTLGERPLAKLTGANFNTTADQAITIPSSKYIIRRININNTSISLTIAAGGFYTAASKSGTAIVSSLQVYSGLTGSTKFADLTLATILTTDVRTETTLYFALTVAQGATATADIYIFGDKFD